jgi:predicted MPP superfamily phosphohydrolase
MGTTPHYLPEIVIVLVSCAVAAAGLRLARGCESAERRNFIRIAILLSLAIIIAGCALAPVRIGSHFPRTLVAILRGAALVFAGFLVYNVFVWFLARSAQRFVPERRKLLQHAATAAVALPVAVGGVAFIQRNDLHLSDTDLRIPGLPEALRGLKIVLISDIHLSPLVSEKDLTRAIELANDTQADLAFVTGDLISTKGDPLDTCLRRLARLRANTGVFGCLGNHEVYAKAESYTAQAGARVGIDFLRSKSRQLHFGDSILNLVGVDYQRKGWPYLAGIDSLVVPGAVNILLSHNPDVFPAAAGMGFDVTFSGHTHGGQVNFEILHPGLNVARFATPYVHGLYEEGGRSIYVTRGIGTIGIPARLGALPEVALIRLCAT